ncbi:PLP-dependent transferase [Streptomyces levis]|uniref:PLP-dependent transferase n=1 Tax=Streptomyces levis TaxID=285566 RepID=UPI003C7AD2AC
MASNFGAPRTLVEQSTVFTYFEYSDNELVSIGVPRGTVRVALGYSNDVADIIKDLEQALSHVLSRAGDSVAS